MDYQEHIDQLNGVYAGLLLEEAERVAAHRSETIRVKEPGMVYTMEYSPGRVNVFVEDGFVSTVESVG